MFFLIDHVNVEVYFHPKHNYNITSILDGLKDYLASNITYVQKFLKEHNIPIKAVATEATYLMWLDCKALGYSHEELIDFFVYKAKLGLNDGESFGKAGEGFMRLNIGTSKAVLEVAMQRLLSAYRSMT